MEELRRERPNQTLQPTAPHVTAPAFSTALPPIKQEAYSTTNSHTRVQGRQILERIACRGRLRYRIGPAGPTVTVLLATLEKSGAVWPLISNVVVVVT
ncbi:MAG: hypothetical protein ACRD6N_03180 [Pyrinomonadaceae bacterium]